MAGSLELGLSGGWDIGVREDWGQGDWGQRVGVGGGLGSKGLGSGVWSWHQLSKVMPKYGNISGYHSLKIIVA